MDGRNQSVGRSESSSDEEEDEGEEGGQEEEQKDTASINQAEPEWKSTTGPMKPTTTDRSVTQVFHIVFGEVEQSRKLALLPVLFKDKSRKLEIKVHLCSYASS